MTLSGSRQARVLMASLALVCLALQVFPMVHLALVEHQVCAEHGELVDARADGSHLAPPATPTDRATASSPNAILREHSHDHCAVVATQRDQLDAAVVTVTLVVHQPADLRHATDVAGTSPLRLLDVAPKASPPV